MSKVFHQNVLALDTSTLTQSIALCAGGVLMSERVLKNRRGHASSLLATLDAVVRDARLTLDDIDLLVVGAGPGSFTGLRIGMACLKGLAFTTQTPLVTVSSLEAIAAQAGPGPGLVIPTIDARKQEIYAGLYRNDAHGAPSAAVTDRAFSLDALVDAIADHHQPDEPLVAMGSAMATYGARLSEALPHITLLPDAFGFPRAAHLAHIAARIAPEDIPPLDSLEPNYQRLSDAEINFDKKAAR